MASTIMREFIRMIEDETQSRPTAAEFELAYQIRIAIERIRFAIKQTEQACGCTDRIVEARMQLLDAFERLEFVERRFHQRSRCTRPDRKPLRTEPSDGSDAGR